MSWVARGKYVKLLLLKAKPAIGRHLLSKREAEEEREVVDEYCRLVAETALGLFIECWPASPWILIANQLTEKEGASTNGSGGIGMPD